MWRWRGLFAAAAAIADAAALVGLLVPGGAGSCSTGTATPGVPAQEMCHGVPAIAAFQSAIPVLALMIALGPVPLVTLRTGRRWPSTASAIAQAVLQVLSFGAFVFWLPAWLLTIATAAAPAPR